LNLRVHEELGGDQLGLLIIDFNPPMGAILHSLNPVEVVSSAYMERSPLCLSSFIPLGVFPIGEMALTTLHEGTLRLLVRGMHQVLPTLLIERELRSVQSELSFNRSRYAWSPSNRGILLFIISTGGSSLEVLAHILAILKHLLKDKAFC
jgi:hypothetical protein